MKEITTVLGNIPSAKLGFCQCHEHILLSKGKSFELNPALCIDDIPKSIDELRRYRHAGGSTIVDAQPIGCNRMTKELAFASESSAINIISSTGFHKLSFYPDSHWIHKISQKELTNIFTEELNKGMFIDTEHSPPNKQCDFQAGLIKTALDTEGLTPRYRALFKAAVNAALKTGCPIMIHIEQNANPLALLEYLTTLGINANRLIFCHLDRASENFDIHLKLATSGVFLEYDTIGRYKYHTDIHEIELVQKLILAGFQRQLLLSLDTTATRLLAYDTNAIGLDYILNNFIPQMHIHGITKKEIHLFMVENPANILIRQK